jgi:uncharacterized protein (TIGR04255 family)
MRHATGVASKQQLTFSYPDNVMLNIHHGLLGRGTILRNPQNNQASNDPFYLLDFDVFREFSLPGTALEVNSSVTQQFVKEYHKIIYRLFRWSVTQEYIATIAEATP